MNTPYITNNGFHHRSVLNHAAYLRQCLDGILNQTYQDFELILLDDHSTDQSAEILKSYSRDARVTHFIINEQNSGHAICQWERGLALAKGEYVWIAESDDYAEPTLLERCMEVLEGNPNVVVCQVGSNLVDESGKPMRNLYERWKGEGNGKVKIYKTGGGNSFISRYLRFYNYLYNASGLVFRRSAALPFPPSAKRYRVCGDWILWLTVAQKGNVAIIRQKLNNFRCCLNSVSRKRKPIEEYTHVFLHNIRVGNFPRRWSHSYYCIIGVILRMIKHDKPELQPDLYRKIFRTFGLRSKMAYHYSQFFNMMNRITPFCVFPTDKKM